MADMKAFFRQEDMKNMFLGKKTCAEYRTKHFDPQNIRYK